MDVEIEDLKELKTGFSRRYGRNEPVTTYFSCKLLT